MSTIIDPEAVSAPEPIDVRVMRDGEWVHVGHAEYLNDGSVSVVMDDTEEGAEISRWLENGYINSYSIFGEESDGSESHA
jgi:hypothetical protein